ncbi:MAG: isoprenyl transferase [Candidatus Desulfofervidaceae bacterium]|nr:isoprenyl transferase [Candidatus Desulfofervidaceae bacterium]MDL1969720.1 isoprenyl transferase [Candidatus Desulfofervidaceae bacterium]
MSQNLVIDPAKLPVHVAIIMDGNGRWAKQRGLPRIAGHQEGTKTAKEIIETAREIGIKVLTLYTFSYENWQRPKEEVDFLMQLLENYLREELPTMLKQDIKFRASGELSLLPENTYTMLQKVITDTSHCQSMILNLTLSYGGRQEILNAVKEIVDAALQGKITPQDINEALFNQYLWTKGLPDPDFIIRTGGEMRLSNFLLWQSAYAEFYITPTFWPDFHRPQFLEALKDYERRERRFGKTSEQLLKENG